MGGSWSLRATFMAILSTSAVLLASCTQAHQQTHLVQADSIMQRHLNALHAKEAEAKRAADKLTSVRKAIHDNDATFHKLTHSVIPSLIAQSDTALRQAQIFRANAAKAHSPKDSKSISEKAQQQQHIADQKAALLMAARQDIDSTQEQTRALQSQVQQLTAQKEKAIRIAKIEADHVKHLEKASATNIVDRSQRSENKPSISSAESTSASDVSNRKNVTHRNSNQHM